MRTKDKTFGLDGVVKMQTCLFLSKPSETIADFFHRCSSGSQGKPLYQVPILAIIRNKTEVTLDLHDKSLSISLSFTWNKSTSKMKNPYLDSLLRRV